MLAAMQKVADDLTSNGRVGYIVPGGGSNPIGALGYVACVQETMAQLFEASLTIDHIVVGSGSSGTHAGMVTGLFGMNVNIPVMGIGVSRDPENQEPLVYREVVATAKLLGLRGEVPRELVKTDGSYWRPKYSLPNKRMIEAIQLLARLEAIPLDPTYTGKIMAGLIGLIRQGVYKKGENVLFIHTGGMPSLFAVTDLVLGKTDVVDL